MKTRAYGRWKIVVKDSGNGGRFPRGALTGIQPGGCFPVVWACVEKEWEVASSGVVTPRGSHGRLRTLGSQSCVPGERPAPV